MMLQTVIKISQALLHTWLILRGKTSINCAKHSGMQAIGTNKIKNWVRNSITKKKTTHIPVRLRIHFLTEILGRAHSFLLVFE